MTVTIKRGDAYPLPVFVKTDGELLNILDIEMVEFTIGHVTKAYPDDVTYDSEKHCFMVPLTQQETFKFCKGTIPMDIRIKWLGGYVEGTKEIAHLVVIDALSREVL